MVPISIDKANFREYVSLLGLEEYCQYCQQQAVCIFLVLELGLKALDQCKGESYNLSPPKLLFDWPITLAHQQGLRLQVSLKYNKMPNELTN